MAERMTDEELRSVVEAFEGWPSSAAQEALDRGAERDRIHRELDRVREVGRSYAAALRECSTILGNENGQTTRQCRELVEEHAAACRDRDRYKSERDEAMRLLKQFYFDLPIGHHARDGVISFLRSLDAPEPAGEREEARTESASEAISRHYGWHPVPQPPPDPLAHLARKLPEALEAAGDALERHQLVSLPVSAASLRRAFEAAARALREE